VFEAPLARTLQTRWSKGAHHDFKYFDQSSLDQACLPLCSCRYVCLCPVRPRARPLRGRGARWWPALDHAADAHRARHRGGADGSAVASGRGGGRELEPAHSRGAGSRAGGSRAGGSGAGGRAPARGGSPPRTRPRCAARWTPTSAPRPRPGRSRSWWSTTSPTATAVARAAAARRPTTPTAPGSTRCRPAWRAVPRPSCSSPTCSRR